MWSYTQEVILFFSNNIISCIWVYTVTAKCCDQCFFLGGVLNICFTCLHATWSSYLPKGKVICDTLLWLFVLSLCRCKEAWHEPSWFHVVLCWTKYCAHTAFHSSGFLLLWNTVVLFTPSMWNYSLLWGKLILINWNITYWTALSIFFSILTWWCWVWKSDSKTDGAFDRSCFLFAAPTLYLRLFSWPLGFLYM